MIEIGDFVPQRVLSDPEDRAWSLYQQDVAGDQIVLCLLRQPDRGAVRAELDKFRDISDRFEAIDSRIFAVTSAPPVRNREIAEQRRLPFPVLSDPSGALFKDFGLDESESGPVAVVVNRNLRLAAILRSSGAVKLAVPALNVCRKLFEATPAGIIAAQAPVLLIPELFDRSLCQRLIESWQQGEKRANEISRAEDDGDAYVDLAADGIKRRQDTLIEDGPLNQEIRALFGRRVVPEIFKAFHYRVKSYEVLRIGCYDSSDGGCFKRHRDDIGDHNDPRRFALSANLNADFEGGELLFPEYGRQVYRPEPGSAVVFSCRLLHEALPVIAGRRFGLFTFFM